MAARFTLKEAGAARDREMRLARKLLRGNSAGIDPSSWESLRRTKVFLKPDYTPKAADSEPELHAQVSRLYANVRPCVPTSLRQHQAPEMDVVIVRENEEDLYAALSINSAERHGDLKALSAPAPIDCPLRFDMPAAQSQKVTCSPKTTS